MKQLGCYNNVIYNHIIHEDKLTTLTCLYLNMYLLCIGNLVNVIWLHVLRGFKR